MPGGSAQDVETAARRQTCRHERRRCRTPPLRCRRRPRFPVGGHRRHRFRCLVPRPECGQVLATRHRGGRTIDGVDYALQDGWQTIDADERAAAENLAVGVEKRSGRPPAERVTAADIRPPIGVNADRHEPLGNEPGDGGIGIACSIHFVTAARPRRDNRKQDRFSFGFGTCERRRAPR